MRKQQKHTLVTGVTDTIAEHNLLGPLADTPLCLSAPLVLMVSGGLDSVSLARIMTQLFDASRSLITIFHVNHMMRGEAADNDEAFVRALAAELAVPCIVERVDIPALAAQSACSSEQIGREERYRLARALLDQRCDEALVERAAGRIATAHTLDDRAETFLMRSMVGAGASGLRSIPYYNERVIRPLLDCTRDDLHEWLETSGNFSWCEDATNADTAYLRAFVRHEVLARMRKRNPEALQALKRTMDILVAEDDFLAQQAHRLEERFVATEQAEYDDTGNKGSEDEASAMLVSADVLKEPLPLARRVIRSVCNQVMTAEHRVTFEHIEAIVTQGTTQGFAISLPGAVDVRNEYGTLRFCREEQKAVSRPRLKVKEPGRGDQGDSTVFLSASDWADWEFVPLSTKDLGIDAVDYAKTYATPTRIFIDAQTLSAPFADANPPAPTAANSGAPPADAHLALPLASLFLDTLKEGERFCPLGMGGQHRLVSDVLIDRKIPARLRKDILVLRAKYPCVHAKKPLKNDHLSDVDDAIIWIVGILQDNRYKVTEKTTTMIRITYKGFTPKGYKL